MPLWFQQQIALATDHMMYWGHEDSGKIVSMKQEFSVRELPEEDWIFKIFTLTMLHQQEVLQNVGTDMLGFSQASSVAQLHLTSLSLILCPRSLAFSCQVIFLPGREVNCYDIPHAQLHCKGARAYCTYVLTVLMALDPGCCFRICKLFTACV